MSASWKLQSSSDKREKLFDSIVVAAWRRCWRSFASNGRSVYLTTWRWVLISSSDRGKLLNREDETELEAGVVVWDRRLSWRERSAWGEQRQSCRETPRRCEVRRSSVVNSASSSFTIARWPGLDIYIYIIYKDIKVKINRINSQWIANEVLCRLARSISDCILDTLSKSRQPKSNEVLCRLARSITLKDTLPSLARTKERNAEERTRRSRRNKKAEEGRWWGIKRRMITKVVRITLTRHDAAFVPGSCLFEVWIDHRRVGNEFVITDLVEGVDY